MASAAACTVAALKCCGRAYRRPRASTQAPSSASADSVKASSAASAGRCSARRVLYTCSPAQAAAPNSFSPTMRELPLSVWKARRRLVSCSRSAGASASAASAARAHRQVPRALPRGRPRASRRPARARRASAGVAGRGGTATSGSSGAMPEAVWTKSTSASDSCSRAAAMLAVVAAPRRRPSARSRPWRRDSGWRSARAWVDSRSRSRETSAIGHVRRAPSSGPGSAPARSGAARPAAVRGSPSVDRSAAAGPSAGRACRARRRRRTATWPSAAGR